jgi:hypothetical protein
MRRMTAMRTVTGCVESSKGDEMAAELSTTEKDEKQVNVKLHGGGSDTVYGLGLIGAWVFYIGRAQNFQEGVVGFFKGIFWPAFLVYELLTFLHKE